MDTFRPLSGSRPPTGTGGGAPVLVQVPTTSSVPSGSKRSKIARSAASRAPTSPATAAKTSCGGAAWATSTATRRNAACSPAIRRDSAYS